MTRKPLTRALEDIDAHADELDLPDVVREEAAVLLRRALRADIDELFSLSALVGAAVYAACQRNNEMVTVADFDESGSTIARAYQSLLSELSIEPPESPRPSLYLSLFAGDLGASEDITHDAQKLLAAFVDADGYIGDNAEAVAAGALYAAGRRQQDSPAVAMEALQDRAGTSEQAIRNRAREIVQATE